MDEADFTAYLDIHTCKTINEMALLKINVKL